MWRQSFYSLRAMLQRRYAAVPLCVFCISVVVYVFAETRHPTHVPNSSAQVVSTQNVENALPLLDGSWDLLWKDSTKQLLRVRICIRQNGTRLVLRSEGSESMRVEKNGSTSGFVTPDQISFTLTLRHTGEMVFTGTLQNGILCGTTNTGLPWMAVRHLD